MKIKRFKKLLRTILVLYLIILACCCIIPPLTHLQATPEQVELSQDASERVLCINDNTDALTWRLRLIEQAKEEVILTTYAFGDDESGRDIMAALQHTAERGVKVRILVDGISAFTQLQSSKYFQALAATSHVQVRIYNPINLLTPWTLNYRMHDKYLIIDNTAYLLGGRNTKNLSLGNYQEKRDIDRDVLVYSPQPNSENSLAQVRAYFEQVWALPCTKPLPYKSKADAATAQQLRQRYDQLLSDHPEAFTTPDLQQRTIPTNGITLLTNPIAPENKAPTLWAALMELMKTGKKVTVQTPYLICSQQMYDDLAQLGSQAEIILNSRDSGANVLGFIDYTNQKQNILSTGITPYEYIGSRSSHTKSVLIDDNLSIIGSFNFDMRSTYLNTETMLVIDCPALNAQLRQIAENNIASSRQILPDGTQILGSACKPQEISDFRAFLYSILQVIVPPFRHLI